MLPFYQELAEMQWKGVKLDKKDDTVCFCCGGKSDPFLMFRRTNDDNR